MKLTSSVCRRGLALTFCLCVLWLTSPASMADPDISGGSGSDYLEIIGNQANARSQSGSLTGTTIDSSDHIPDFRQFRWVSVCQSVGDSANLAGPIDCGMARSCPDPLERLWRLWGEKVGGGWVGLYTQCFGRPPTAAQTPQPQVTPGLVLQAIRRIGLPALQAHTQPADKTLINFATIFYTEPQAFTRAIRLLGQRVEVEATPSSFTWHHGDGTSATTTQPGAPYPAKDVTYEYTHAHTTVQTSVDVTYTARFRVNGGAWQDIPDTVTIAGPATDLRVSEATAVLSGQYE